MTKPKLDLTPATSPSQLQAIWRKASGEPKDSSHGLSPASNELRVAIVAEMIAARVISDIRRGVALKR